MGRHVYDRRTVKKNKGRYGDGIYCRDAASFPPDGGICDNRQRKYYHSSGHGGIDPGKVGINQALEKDINLVIARKVKRYLELSDVEVIMTREGEEGLYQPEDSNKKVQDMKNRVALIDSSGADLAVSIHQNSYSEEYVKGAQVFYYATSLQGKSMAEMMQKTMTEVLDKDNRREAKANDSYYLLKKTQTPIIIAECGFLSNSEEAGLLTKESYQDRVAWAIHLGVLRYAASLE